MKSEVRKWFIGLTYIFAVAGIWIAASYVVQSVVDDGISPFLITYICNALFVIYIPIVEVARLLEDYSGNLSFWRNRGNVVLQQLATSEDDILLENTNLGEQTSGLIPNIYIEEEETNQLSQDIGSSPTFHLHESDDTQLDAKGRWTRTRVAKVSLLICPFWFLAQLFFNVSLKYTTVTVRLSISSSTLQICTLLARALVRVALLSNTILSTSSSLFTFLLSLVFLGEKFTWFKLTGVLLCMGGTIIVSLGDTKTGLNAINSNPIMGDILALSSSAMYAVYVTLIRKKLPDDENNGQVSTAQFLGFLGLFNLVFFLPVALVLSFAKRASFTTLNRKQLGLIVGKGLLDNVLSDYLWAKAVLLTTTTVATAGLTIQIPLAALVDTLTGNAPSLVDYIGASAIMFGFAGINIPSDAISGQSKEPVVELVNGSTVDQIHVLADSEDATENL